MLLKRSQILILALMAILAIALFCVVAFFSRSLLQPPDPTLVAQQVAATADAAFTPRPTATPSLTPTPTNTLTPTPTDTPVPTPTATRVVHSTATPTPSKTPTLTPIPTSTPTNTPIPQGGVGGGYAGGPAPTAVPTSRYPFAIIAEPLVYTTSNHIFVILAQVTRSSVPVPGYRLVGTHSPTGFQWQSPLSCDDLCKASGPEAVYDEEGERTKTFLVQKGNLAFEAPVYETGVWSLMLVDAKGQQVSEVFQIQLDATEKQWFYYLFNRP
jgi:hypothetical protein